VASHCKVQGYSAVICAKTAKPIEMSFELWTWMGRRNRVFDGGLAVLRDVAMVTTFGTAMATNFGTKIAINWLCVNDSA